MIWHAGNGAVVWFRFQYRQAVGGKPGQQQNMRKNASSRSFQAFGFDQQRKGGGGGERGGKNGPPAPVEEDNVSTSGLPRRGSHINVNVAPATMDNDTPEIRKYKKRFNSDILCAALWGKCAVLLVVKGTFCQWFYQAATEQQGTLSLKLSGGNFTPKLVYFVQRKELLNFSEMAAR